MIRVTVRKNTEGKIHGFSCEGHALYDDAGKDVVCAAVSMLAINTVNAIEKLAGIELDAQSDPQAGILYISFKEELNEKAQILMDAMILGITMTEKGYGSEFVNYTEIVDS